VDRGEWRRTACRAARGRGGRRLVVPYRFLPGGAGERVRWRGRGSPAPRVRYEESYWRDSGTVTDMWARASLSVCGSPEGVEYHWRGPAPRARERHVKVGADRRVAVTAGDRSTRERPRQSRVAEPIQSHLHKTTRGHAIICSTTIIGVFQWLGCIIRCHSVILIF
jgi:hypothetical protein